MSLTLADFRRLLRRGLGNIDSSDMSNAECDELLNFSLWEIEDQFEFEIKETEYTTPLVESQSQYNLAGIPLLDALVSVSYVDENGMAVVLDRMTRKQYDDLYDDGSENTVDGEPEKYLREGNILIIWPPPKAELEDQSLRLALKQGIASISSLGTGLPRNWDWTVLNGAISLGHHLNQDYDMRDKSENFKLSKIRATVTTEAKEEEDSRYAGLQVAWDRPSMDTEDDDLD